MTLRADVAQTDMVLIGRDQLLHIKYDNQGTHSQSVIRMSASDDVNGYTHFDVLCSLALVNSYHAH